MKQSLKYAKPVVQEQLIGSLDASLLVIGLPTPGLPLFNTFLQPIISSETSRTKESLFYLILIGGSFHGISHYGV